MIGSTTPLAEFEWHPVHRANALLRAALLSSAHSAERPEDPPSAELLSHAIDSVMQGPVSITFPQPLAARLDALAMEDAFPDFQARAGQCMQSLPVAAAPPGEDLPEEWDDDAPNELIAGEPIDPAIRVQPAQIHVQTLLDEFHRRQRHASLLVAGSIATAVLLTVGGLVLVANLSAPRAGDGDNRPALRTTSVAWQRPAASNGIPHSAIAANRDAKGESLLMPALAGAQGVPEMPASAPLILAASGRQVAFAPLLPPSPAGYYLIRGLPGAAKLSAGRQSNSGTWLVKAEHAPALTLSIGEVAEGDYPVEVYVLRSGDSPQARRSLVLRVDAPPAPAQQIAGADRRWASALLDVVPAARAAEAPAVPVESAVLSARAQRLLHEGDIAAARLLLLYLAERGEGEAAYELARTFDREMLAALGAKGVEGDLARARGWYERASQGGNAKAKERLKILASLSGSGPSD